MNQSAPDRRRVDIKPPPPYTPLTHTHPRDAPNMCCPRTLEIDPPTPTPTRPREAPSMCCREQKYCMQVGGQWGDDNNSVRVGQKNHIFVRSTK